MDSLLTFLEEKPEIGGVQRRILRADCEGLFGMVQERSEWQRGRSPRSERLGERE